MPSTYIKKLVKEGKGTKADLEHKWETAKKAAADQGRTDDYQYITGIFNHIIGASVSDKEIAAVVARLNIKARQKVRIEAAIRLRT